MHNSGHLVPKIECYTLVGLWQEQRWAILWIATLKYLFVNFVRRQNISTPSQCKEREYSKVDGQSRVQIPQTVAQPPR